MAKDMIRDVYKGIVVHAKGKPATIVAVAASAGVAAVAAGLGYGVYQAARALRGAQD